MSYNYLDDVNSWYTHIKHNHGAGSFGFGIQSTSHIESIWSQIKSKIKATYNTIPNKNILHFVREAEYKILLKKGADNLTRLTDSNLLVPTENAKINQKLKFIKISILLVFMIVII